MKGLLVLLLFAVAFGKTLEYSELESHFREIMNLNVTAVGDKLGGAIKKHTHPTYDKKGNEKPALFQNACPIRMAYALLKSGFKFSKKDSKRMTTDEDDNYYPRSVKTVKEYIKKHKLYKSVIKTTVKNFDALNGHHGMIFFTECTWSDANGHVDLFNGERVVSDNGDERDYCKKVELYVLN